MGDEQQRTTRFPLWARWALAALVAVAIVAVVVERGSAARGGAQSEGEANAEADRDGLAVMAADQAPHVARLTRGTIVLAGLESAITADVERRIAQGELTGPLRSVHCVAAGATRAGRRPYRCAVTSGGISYPFVAVYGESSLTLTWCKEDLPPEPGAKLEVPVSARCLA
jgi:hypothetical protein